MTRAATLQARAEAARAKATEADDAALRAALVEARGHMGHAAVALGVSYRTLQRKIDRAGLAEWLRAEYPLSGRQPTKG